MNCRTFSTNPRMRGQSHHHHHHSEGRQFSCHSCCVLNPPFFWSWVWPSIEHSWLLVVCCAHKGKTGTGKSAQVLTQESEELTNSPSSQGIQQSNFGHTAQHISQSAMDLSFMSTWSTKPQMTCGCICQNNWQRISDHINKLYNGSIQISYHLSKKKKKRKKLWTHPCGQKCGCATVLWR